MLANEFHKKTAPMTITYTRTELLIIAALIISFTGTILWFDWIDFYHQHFFETGVLVIVDNIARILFVAILSWLIYVPGAGIATLIMSSSEKAKLTLAERAVVGFGILFLRLHALPEHIAHGTHKVQMELVSVLCLIALFTHMHIFWIAGLILAFIDIPDFGSPLRRIADSVGRMAGGEPVEATAETRAATHHPSHEAPAVKPGDGTAAPPAKAPTTPAKKEVSHA